MTTTGPAPRCTAGAGMAEAGTPPGGMQLRQNSLPLTVVTWPAWMSVSGMLSLQPSQK